MNIARQPNPSRPGRSSATAVRRLAGIALVGATALTGCSASAPTLNEALKSLQAANKQLDQCFPTDSTPPTTSKPCTAQFNAVMDAMHTMRSALPAQPDSNDPHWAEYQLTIVVDRAWQRISSGKEDPASAQKDRVTVAVESGELAYLLQQSPTRKPSS